MRIDYIKLVGYKRFRLANIHIFEASFPEAVTMIVSESGKGKSSLLSQLNPTPAVRTDFEKDGYKEIWITHERHQYKLVSDFSNKTSPHSFIMDDVELNIGHTTDVQTELVWKHFKISSLINNLVYAKIKLTETSKSERKNLFLAVNPIDLELVVNTHKKVMNRLRDCKANLQMLQARKVQLEGEMIDETILAQHIETKNKLMQLKQTTVEMMILLQQHLAKIEEDRDYGVTSTISLEELRAKADAYRKANCYKILGFGEVPRDEQAYNALKDAYSAQLSELKTRCNYLAADTENISGNINKYTSHLEEAKNNPVSALECEIQHITTEMSQYVNLPNKPIDVTHVDLLYKIIGTITENILIIKDSGTNLIPESVVREMYNNSCTLKTVVASETDKKNKLLDIITFLNNNANTIKEKEHSNVPSTCMVPQCKLRQSIVVELDAINKQLETTTGELAEVERSLAEHTGKLAELNDKLAPFLKYRLITRFNEISRQLRSYFGYDKSDDDLMQDINIKGALVASELNTLVEGSVAYTKYTALKDKKRELMDKLNTLVQSSKVSSEFITAELNKMKDKLADNLRQLDELKGEYNCTKGKYDTLLEYKEVYEQAVTLLSGFNDAERKLIVNKSHEYWSNLRAVLQDYSYKLDTKLRTLETLVETQEKIRYNYNNEILSQLAVIEKDKSLYEKLEMALSPNSGIPHRYMVKYLNTLINNVNHFLSKVWSYPLVVSNIDEHDSIDYTFSVRVGNEVNKDISMLSDGQSEIMNLVWTLTILLQMKLLNNMPFYADEITRCMDSYHRTKTIEFLNSLLDNKLIEQCFIINHFVSVSEGFKNCNIVCLSTDNLSDIPENTNKNVSIINY